MKLLPHSRFGKLRCVLILSVFVYLVAAYRPDRLVSYHLSAKAEGDILMQSLPRGELVDAIEGISQSEWSHCGILVRHNGEWHVAEAIGEVRYTPLHLWLMRGRRFKVVAFRVNQLAPNAPEALKTGMRKLLGVPYDFRYAPDDAEIYCSELVNKLYARELGITVGAWERLEDLNWKPSESFIRYMESGQLPLDRMMITPVALTRSPNVTGVFP
jgi:hypothetical protein